MSTIAVSSTTLKSSYCVAPPRNNFQPLCKRPSPSISAKSYPKYITLKNVLPATFTDMYTPEILSSTTLTTEGRPSFTQRDIIDWSKNDIRSLLILEAPLPEWKSSSFLPQIIESGYRIQILPFDASDSEIIETLVSSDLYKEHKFEKHFLVQTAEYTVKAARERQAQTHLQQQQKLHPQNGQQPRKESLKHSHMPFTKPEWRNVIENYLLNLACEAQCRVNFQQSCSDLKRQKLMMIEAINNDETRRSSPKSCSPLLKKAILTSLSTSPKYNVSASSNSKIKASLTRFEKQQIWVNVQSNLYKRLGLNWLPDELV